MKHDCAQLHERLCLLTNYIRLRLAEIYAKFDMEPRETVIWYFISCLCWVWCESKFHMNDYVYESLIWNPGHAPISISFPGRGPISRYQACKLMCGNSLRTLWQPAAYDLRLMADMADEHHSWERIQSAVGDECHWKHSCKYEQCHIFFTAVWFSYW